MRDLTDFALQCMDELDSIGIEYGNIIDFTVNTRAKNRWGQCKAVPGGYRINISAVLLDERNDEQGLKNTIIHELLHSCKGCMNHGENWKRLAAKVYREYGYNIKRTSSAAEKGMCEEAIAERVEAKKQARAARVTYKLQCEKCGHIYTHYRMCDAIRYPNLYSCGCAGCHGQLIRIS